MDGIREKVCRRVRELRTTAGLTQEQLAERASLSVDVIRRIETLRATPMLETLEKICQALRVSLAELLRFEAPEPPTERQQELEKLYLYLATRDAADIRSVRRVVEAVIEELEKKKGDRSP
jgi:transcriptional regulator with XRE-family HTH domain